jgi:hypothetical protein
VQEHEIEVIIAMEEGERRTRKIADFFPVWTNAEEQNKLSIQSVLRTESEAK